MRRCQSDRMPINCLKWPNQTTKRRRGPLSAADLELVTRPKRRLMLRRRPSHTQPADQMVCYRYHQGHTAPIFLGKQQPSGGMFGRRTQTCRLAPPTGRCLAVRRHRLVANSIDAVKAEAPDAFPCPPPPPFSNCRTIDNLGPRGSVGRSETSRNGNEHLSRWAARSTTGDATSQRRATESRTTAPFT